jgi:hypothetical protein
MTVLQSSAKEATMRRCVGVLLLGVLFLVPHSAAADPFTPGQVFTVQFSMRGIQYPAALGVPDVLAFFVTSNVIEPVDSLTVQLFDRTSVLGTYSSAQLDQPPGFRDHAAGYFAAQGSSFRFRNPATIDFSTFRNGTFDGRVEFSIDSGVVDLERDHFSVFLGTSEPSGEEALGINIAPAAVPEPASLSLLALGLAGLGARRWRQRKA